MCLVLRNLQIAIENINDRLKFSKCDDSSNPMVLFLNLDKIFHCFASALPELIPFVQLLYWKWSLNEIYFIIVFIYILLISFFHEIPVE